VVVICWMLSAAIGVLGVYLFRRMQQPQGPDVCHEITRGSPSEERWLEALFEATPEPDLMQKGTPSKPSSPLFRPRLARGSTPPFGQGLTRAGSVPLRPRTEPVGEETTDTDTIIVDPSVFEELGVD
jgi:hypothetical protein